MKKHAVLPVILLIIFSLSLPLGVVAATANGADETNAAGATGARERLLSYNKHLEMKEQSLFKTLTWRSVGPYFMGGRIDDIESSGKDPYKFYVASASGGLWVTENNGTTWTPVFDHESSITIGDIALSATDEKLIWVGTGEQNSSRSSYAGTGVFKSTDGGKSWKNMGLTDSHHIGKVIIHPTNNNIVYVAALGHLYTDNEERGLFKTTDGGKTWEKILYVNAKTGVIDVVMHPRNPAILYAASWERERKAWNFIEGGFGSCIYKSTDGGESWKKIVSGFPQNQYVGRIGLAVTPAKPDVLYAFLDNQEPRALKKEKKGKEKKGKKKAADSPYTTSIKGAEVYRSDDAGETWRKTHQHILEGLVYTYGYYFGQIRVAPDNEDVLYLLGVPLLKSTDGGKTFKNLTHERGVRPVNQVHGDMQSLWIDPNDSRRLLLGNDGGVDISYDAGTTWQAIDNLPLGQCYTVHYDFQKPYRIYTGLQDNGVNMGRSDFRLGQRKDPWVIVMGGDGAFSQTEPRNPNILYAAFQFGSLFRINHQADTQTFIQPKSEDKNAPYRFNWLAPFIVSPHNPYTLYMGGNKMLKSVNRGDSWFEISPDLTRQENTHGDVPFATIVALDESPLAAGFLYAGTDDGNLWVKKGSSAGWEKITEGIPAKWVTRVVASKYKKGRLYITLTGYREDDFNTYVFASENYGETWTSLKANLPEEALNVIREDPVNENILYLGSDLGIYITLDRGKTWQSLKNNLPTNAVYDMRVHPREKELIIGTHGRGVFIISVAAIQKMTPEILAKPLYLFDISPVTYPPSPYMKQPDALFEFYCGSAGSCRVSIQNKEGNVLKEIETKAVAGLNRLQWDLVVNKKKVEKGNYTVVFGKGKSEAKGCLDVK